MDADEIRTLLGDNIFERAKKYRKRIQQSTCTVNEDGVRHISAMVQGSGGSYYYTQAWLRENGSFVSASCSCPYNQNGEGTYCKHIGALLLDDAEKNAPAPAAKPDAIPGVVRGAAGLAPEPARVAPPLGIGEGRQQGQAAVVAAQVPAFAGAQVVQHALALAVHDDAHIPDAGIDHVGEHKVHHPIVAAEGDGAVDALLDELPQSGFLFIGKYDAVHSVHASTSP